MQTRALRTLVTISKIGAFVETADHLNMTPSAVSMQMKHLEEDLGVDLFDRSYRPPKLTPLGREVAEQAAQLLASEDALQDLCRHKDDLIGQFRFGFVATASVRLLPSFLEKANQTVPGARFDVEVDVSEVLEGKVKAGQMDAAVVTASSSPLPGLQYRTLRTERMVFAAPKAYPVSSGDITRQEMPFLQFTPDVGIGIQISKYMEDLTDQEPPVSRQRLVLNSVEAIMQCVNQGLGYTLLPEPDVARYADEAVTKIEQPEIQITRQLVLAIQPASPIGRRIDLVIELFS